MNRSVVYPRLVVEAGAVSAVGQAGAVLLGETVRASGIGTALSGALAAWRKPMAVHDPAKILLDVAVSLALGGEFCSDVGLLRAEPELFGRVALNPTISRTIDTLAAEDTAVLAAIDTARAAARARVWALAGEHAPDHEASAAHPVVVDLDATLIGSHSEKEQARPTYKRGFGFHPLAAFCDHGAQGTGEPLALLLRPGNAGANTAADHITVTAAALAQLPTTRDTTTSSGGGDDGGGGGSRQVLVRTDSAGSTHAFLTWLTEQGVSYSVGFGLHENTTQIIAALPEQAWSPAYNADGDVRDGAWVAELTGVLALGGWPAGMRVIARKERPHPGAQLRITDPDGHSGHRVRHQHTHRGRPAHPTRRPGTPPPCARPLR